LSKGVTNLKILEFFRKRKDSIKQLAGSVALLLLAGSVGIGFGLYKTNGTKKYVMEAVDYIKDNNWVALYNYAEMEDDDFINEYFFELMAKQKYGEVNSDTVTLENIEKGDKSADVKVYYKNGDGEKISCDFVMEKKSTKQYVIFNEWKLDINEHIMRSCSVAAPEGFLVYVDGVELTKDNAQISYNESLKMNEYVMPRIFEGSHTIFVKKDMIEVQESVVLWDKDECQYIVDSSKLQLSESVRDYLKTSGEKIIQLMYKNVFEETKLTGLENYLLSDEKSQTAFMALYDKILAAIQPEDGSTLNSLNITGFDNYKIEYAHPDKAIVSIDFACTFKARGPRDAASGARDKYEGEAKSTVGFEFVYDGSKWVCSSLNMDCIDYSKKEEVETEE
jgi:hypothetical protein